MGEEGRLRWTSRTTFLLAAIGSAVGLGNIWRFPWLSFKYGGGIFLIPYLLALVLVGLPMLMVELGLGRTTQRGDVEAFGKCHRRARGVGFSSIFGGFMVSTYYVNIIAWSLVYLVASVVAIFDYPFAWKGREKEYLFDTVLHSADDSQVAAARSYVISGWVFGGLVFIWAFMYFAVARGVKSVGNVVKITVPAPVILLVIMLIYTSTLDGAGDGVNAYIGQWNTDGLKDASVWPAAVGQIFFSNGIAVGIMTAYGSYNPESSDIVADNCIIAMTNSAVSFLSGFAVYTVLGHIAHRDGTSIGQAGDVNGVALTFLAYPSAVTTFPQVWAQIMSIMFFFTLFTLGIDCALAMIEAGITVIQDTAKYRHVPRGTLAAYICGTGFLLSTIYATDLGVAMISVVDHYINTYGVMITGVAEAITVSWIYGWSDTAQRVGKLSAQILTFGYFGSVLIGIVLCGGLYDAMDNHSYFAVGVPVGVYLWMVSFVAAFVTRKDRTMNVGYFTRSVAFAGTQKLRNSINEAAAKYGNMRLPIVWDILVKFLIPPMLLGLCVSASISDATNTESDFHKSPWWIHAIGIAILTIMLASLFGFAIFPQFWEIGFGDNELAHSVRSNGHTNRSSVRQNGAGGGKGGERCSATTCIEMPQREPTNGQEVDVNNAAAQ